MPRHEFPGLLDIALRHQGNVKKRAPGQYEEFTANSSAAYPVTNLQAGSLTSNIIYNRHVHTYQQKKHYVPSRSLASTKIEKIQKRDVFVLECTLTSSVIWTRLSFGGASPFGNGLTSGVYKRL